MASAYASEQVSRLPRPADNCAIALQRVDAGTEITFNGNSFNLDYSVLEGHRFAVRPISCGQALLSWGLPFGLTLRHISPGNYVCNEQILEELRVRNPSFELPPEPNFRDEFQPYVLEGGRFQLGQQVPRHGEIRTFMGYRRSPARGVGTRNYIVILGTTSRTSSYARVLGERLKGITASCEHIDGIVCVSHTEGGSEERPNNLEFLLRTLAGFMVHPNVGAVLAVDYGSEMVTNEMLRHFMEGHGYPLKEVLHRRLTLRGSFQASLEKGEKIIRGWLNWADGMPRTEEAIAELKIALQCGGSDAFSGISANPLAAWVAKEIIRYGGAANLAETDELIGAESYVLKNVRDLDTVRRFLSTVERFKERMAWHGHTAEGNPSGGNKFRGLYNIALKSIGAAMKLHPQVRLDHVIDYGERMLQPGFYFMDSPGNDLESVAGQVAAGTNMIFFTTGSGSITNFPFVPTVKIMSTTRRYELVSREMDVNAGAYLGGTPMQELGRRMLELTIEVASGARTKGERAGHYQVSIWRDWRQTDTRNLKRLLRTPEPAGKPLPIKVDGSDSRLTFKAIRQGNGYTTDQIGLILPTSLCAGQIARMIAGRLNGKGIGQKQHLSRFVALVHTEGCGVSGGSSEVLYTRTLLGYLTHPLVKFGLLLEHGCEKTHNDYMRNQLEQLERDPGKFGWASVQLDGGIERVMQKVENWFEAALSGIKPPLYETVGLRFLRLGLLASGAVPVEAARSLVELTRTVVGAGGTVVVPQATSLLSSSVYVEGIRGASSVEASLAYGQRTEAAGFYVMHTPTKHWVEILTGLGATGVQLILTHIGGHPVQGHPMIPLAQVTSQDSVRQLCGEDLDLLLEGQPALWSEQMLKLLANVASRRYVPRLHSQGNTDFQFARGLLGVSM
ncbi:UxaA family hydrolase [Acidobacteria bacterium AH-259-O06]|nr:UxaA family hydrolase [Acidobacteria bacterium AH-259-O06]